MCALPSAAETGHDQTSFDSAQVPPQQMVQKELRARADAGDNSAVSRLSQRGSQVRAQGERTWAILVHSGEAKNASEDRQVCDVGQQAEIEHDPAHRHGRFLRVD